VRPLGLCLILLLCQSARAQPITLRVGTPAPDGTSWAREGRAWARDVETLTNGRIRVKLYLGGIAGDDLHMADRATRGQLDLIASGGMACLRLAPSMRALSVLGLFQTREESAYVSGRLKPVLDEEFRKSGFANLGEVGIGPNILFTRKPVADLAALKRTRMWRWDIDPIMGLELPAIGVDSVPASVADAGRLYDDHRVDGFIVAPVVALAFQWSAQTRYVTNLPVSFLRGCILITDHALDQLSVGDQQLLRTATAKFIARLEDSQRAQDDLLLGGLFKHQGVTEVPVTSVFRAELAQEAQAVRARLGEQLLPSALLQRVLGMLADYRGEHKGN
jgi:TRAP-type C4-dicarboxylate transport system substrate-binding protein